MRVWDDGEISTLWNANPLLPKTRHTYILIYSTLASIDKRTNYDMLDASNGNGSAVG